MLLILCSLSKHLPCYLPSIILFLDVFVQLLDRCADGMVFGALEPCETCSGQLFAGTNSYRCSGNISGWTKCTETPTVAKRSPWIIPKEFKKEIPFLLVI